MLQLRENKQTPIATLNKYLLRKGLFTYNENLYDWNEKCNV